VREDAVAEDAGRSDPMPAGLTRRAVLSTSAALSGAAAVMLLSACKGVQVLGSPPAPPANVRLLRSAISAEELMVARYTTALSLQRGGTTADPTISAVLSAVRAEHMQHLAQLRVRLIEPAADRTSPAHHSPPGLPGSLTDVLQTLEAAEQAASDRLIGQLSGLPPSLAQLLASIAASEATHVPFLRAARQGR